LIKGKNEVRSFGAGVLRNQKELEFASIPYNNFSKNRNIRSFEWEKV